MAILFKLLALALMLFNLFGGIGSAMWLAALGEWWALGYGVLAIVLASLFLNLLLLPGVLLVYPALVVMERGKPMFAFPFVILNLIYTFSLVSAWCLVVFHWFMDRAAPESFWPLLIWSYSVALAPWMYMAQKERTLASLILAVSAQAAYFAVAGALIFADRLALPLNAVFCAVMSMGFLFQVGSILFSAPPEARPKTE